MILTIYSNDNYLLLLIYSYAIAAAVRLRWLLCWRPAGFACPAFAPSAVDFTTQDWRSAFTRGLTLFRGVR